MNARPKEILRVLVASRSLRERSRLESLVGEDVGLRLAGTAGDAVTCDRLSAQLLPDVVLLSIGPPDTLDQMEARAAGAGGPPIVVLLDAAGGEGRPGREEGPFYRSRGAIHGLLPREASAAAIHAAISAAAEGLLVSHPRLAARAYDDRAAVAPVPDPLTPREEEVLRMIAEGLANKAIAAELGITPHTVKFHVTSIMQKLGAESRTEAVTKGLRRGLLLL